MFGGVARGLWAGEFGGSDSEASEPLVVPSNAVRANAALDGVQALECDGGVGVVTRGGAGGGADVRAFGEAPRECGWVSG